jgi:hypothetical protein
MQRSSPPRCALLRRNGNITLTLWLAQLPHPVGIQNREIGVPPGLRAFNSRRVSWLSRTRTRNARPASTARALTTIVRVASSVAEIASLGLGNGQPLGVRSSHAGAVHSAVARDRFRTKGVGAAIPPRVTAPSPKQKQDLRRENTNAIVRAGGRWHSGLAERASAGPCAAGLLAAASAVVPGARRTWPGYATRRIRPRDTTVIVTSVGPAAEPQSGLGTICALAIRTVVVSVVQLPSPGRMPSSCRRGTTPVRGQRPISARQYWQVSEKTGFAVNLVSLS